MRTIPDTGNKAVFPRFYEATNSHDDNLISKTVDELFRPDVRLHNPVPSTATGPQAVKEVFRQLHKTFPDLHVSVDDLIEEGDKVVVRSTVTGTNQGDYLGRPPTGKSVAYEEIFIGRFVDGRIAELWGVVDALAMLKQLGVVAV